MPRFLRTPAGKLVIAFEDVTIPDEQMDSAQNYLVEKGLNVTKVMRGKTGGTTIVTGYESKVMRKQTPWQSNAITGTLGEDDSPNIRTAGRVEAQLKEFMALQNS